MNPNAIQSYSGLLRAVHFFLFLQFSSNLTQPKSGIPCGWSKNIESRIPGARQMNTARDIPRPRNRLEMMKMAWKGDQVIHLENVLGLAERGSKQLSILDSLEYHLVVRENEDRAHQDLQGRTGSWCSNKVFLSQVPQ